MPNTSGIDIHTEGIMSMTPTQISECLMSTLSGDLYLATMFISVMDQVYFSLRAYGLHSTAKAPGGSHQLILCSIFQVTAVSV